MSEIILAQSAGFCFGVSRAMDIIYELIEKSDVGTDIATIGPLIHNPQVITELESKGVRCVSDVDELNDATTAVIRTHGVPESFYQTLKEKNVNYFDTTCPFVSKIQQIAKKAKLVIVAGDPNHPEVIGINGFASDSMTVSSLEELEKLTEKYDFLRDSECFVVAQTTFSINEWKKISEFIKNNYTNAKIFDTICNATNERQIDAGNLAKECDAIIVIGGRNSSNTTKLFEICREHCPNTFHIETVNELPINKLKKYKKIGITAGASTPAAIIKEVKRIMDENIREMDTEFSFEKEIENSMMPLQNGDRVNGIVIAVTDSEIQVDVGAKQAGYVVISEYSSDPNIILRDVVKPGDELELLAVRVNDVEGTVMLSRRRIEAVEGYEELQTALNSGEPLGGVVTEVIKDKGLIVVYKGASVFVPASHSGTPRDSNLDNLLKATVKFKVIEIKQGRRRRIIGSIKRAINDVRSEKEKEILTQIEVGKKFTGIVKSLTSFGAFVDIGGIDGLIHISELSWSSIKHPSEVTNVGDSVDVYIKDFDPEAKRISLGYKNPEDNPFNVFNKKYAINDVIEAKIVRIVPFGAFAEIVPGVDGLIHISQISNERINKIHDALTVGQVVNVKIVDINLEKQKISLSIRALLTVEEEASDVIEPDVVIASTDDIIVEAAEPTVTEVTEEPAE